MSSNTGFNILDGTVVSLFKRLNIKRRKCRQIQQVIQEKIVASSQILRAIRVNITYQHKFQQILMQQEA